MILSVHALHSSHYCEHSNDRCFYIKKSQSHIQKQVINNLQQYAVAEASGSPGLALCGMTQPGVFTKAGSKDSVIFHQPND